MRWAPRNGTWLGLRSRNSSPLGRKASPASPAPVSPNSIHMRARNQSNTPLQVLLLLIVVATWGIMCHARLIKQPSNQAISSQAWLGFISSIASR